MPPVYAQDPFFAVHQALHAGWLDVPMAAVSVACEAWVLALVALAVYSWVERDTRSVLGVFIPLAVALALGAASGHALTVLSNAPRPVVGRGLVAWRAVPSGAVLETAAFAAYTAAAYGRRGLAALAAPALGTLSAAHTGGGWASSVPVGLVLGAVLGFVAWAAALRALPTGRLAALRSARRTSASIRSTRARSSRAKSRDLDREAKLP